MNKGRLAGFLKAVNGRIASAISWKNYGTATGVTVPDPTTRLITDTGDNLVTDTGDNLVYV